MPKPNNVIAFPGYHDGQPSSPHADAAKLLRSAAFMLDAASDVTNLDHGADNTFARNWRTAYYAVALLRAELIDFDPAYRARHPEVDDEFREVYYGTYRAEHFVAWASKFYGDFVALVLANQYRLPGVLAVVEDHPVTDTDWNLLWLSAADQPTSPRHLAAHHS